MVCGGPSYRSSAIAAASSLHSYSSQTSRHAEAVEAKDTLMVRFLLQIVEVDAPHSVVRLPGGGLLERDLITACTDAIVAKGVGFGKTEAQVRQAIAEGITDTIRALKRDTRAAL